jgi:hypothetical protein
MAATMFGVVAIPSKTPCGPDATLLLTFATQHWDPSEVTATAGDAAVAATAAMFTGARMVKKKARLF